MTRTLALAFAALSLFTVACGGQIDEPQGARSPEGASADQSLLHGGVGGSSQPGGGAGGSSGDPASGTRPDAPATAPDAPSSAPAAPARYPVCDEAEDGVLSFTSEAAFVGAMLGTWALCDDVSVFGSSEAGLEITADGRWYKLYAEGGKLVRGKGFDRAGRWSIIDTSGFNGAGSYQLNLDVDGGGTVITHPALSGGPRKMRLNNNGVFEADYALIAATE